MHTLRAAVDSLMFSLESMAYDPSVLAIILCGITTPGCRMEVVHRIAIRGNIPTLALLHAVAHRAQADEDIPQGVRDVCAALEVMTADELRKAGGANG